MTYLPLLLSVFRKACIDLGTARPASQPSTVRRDTPTSFASSSRFRPIFSRMDRAEKSPGGFFFTPRLCRLAGESQRKMRKAELTRPAYAVCVIQ